MIRGGGFVMQMHRPSRQSLRSSALLRARAAWSPMRLFPSSRVMMWSLLTRQFASGKRRALLQRCSQVLPAIWSNGVLVEDEGRDVGWGELVSKRIHNVPRPNVCHVGARQVDLSQGCVLVQGLSKLL